MRKSSGGHHFCPASTSVLFWLDILSGGFNNEVQRAIRAASGGDGVGSWKPHRQARIAKNALPPSHPRRTIPNLRPSRGRFFSASHRRPGWKSRPLQENRSKTKARGWTGRKSRPAREWLEAPEGRGGDKGAEAGGFFRSPGRKISSSPGRMCACPDRFPEKIDLAPAFCYCKKVPQERLRTCVLTVEAYGQPGQAELAVLIPQGQEQSARQVPGIALFLRRAGALSFSRWM